MAIIRPCLFAFFLFSFQLLFSQSEFQEGYIITIENDTLQGFLSFDKKNPIPLNFRAEGSSDVGVFNHGEVLAFATDDAPNRIYRYLDIDVASRNDQLLDRSPDPILKKEHVYLELIEAGALTLYYFRDRWNNDHFFFEREGRPIEELIYTRYIKDKEVMGIKKPVFIENRKYQIQFTFFMSDCPNAFELIDGTDYTIYDMRKITKAYNQCHGNTQSFDPKGEKNKSLKIGVFGGYSWSKFNFNYALLAIAPNTVDLDRNFHPYFGVSLRATEAFNNERLSVYNELGYGRISGFSKYRYTRGDEHYEDHDLFLSTTYIRLLSMLRYEFPTQTVQPFLSAGLTYGRTLKVSSYLNNKITYLGDARSEFLSGVFEVEKSEAALVVGGGASIGPVRAEIRWGYGTGIGSGSSSSHVAALVGFEF